MNLLGVEGGYDKQVYADCYDKVYLGVMAGYLYTDRIKSRMKNGDTGTALANTPSIGAYATWLNKEGWFADAAVRGFYSMMKASGRTAQGASVRYRPGRGFTAASVEFGRQLRAEHLILEPKVELQYAYAQAKNFGTNIGNKISYSDTAGLTARAALMAAYGMKLDNGAVLEPFVEFGMSNEFDGVTKIKYAGADFRSDLGGVSYDVIGGLNMKLSDMMNIYGEAAYEKGSKVEAISGNVGVRWNW
jgi:outer membrane autotransporter protein